MPWAYDSSGYDSGSPMITGTRASRKNQTREAMRRRSSSRAACSQIEADAVRALDRAASTSASSHARRADRSRRSGRVVVSGMGKSRPHRAQDRLHAGVAPARRRCFVHPAEASHGDLGMIEPGDVFIAISYSGESEELLDDPAAGQAPRRQADRDHRQARSRRWRAKPTCTSTPRVEQEACPLNLAPTASTTAALALGDALAVALLDARGFSAEDFARSHPGGSARPGAC